jgi:hypothetical protein
VLPVLFVLFVLPVLFVANPSPSQPFTFNFQLFTAVESSTVYKDACGGDMEAPPADFLGSSSAGASPPP